jgi:hypothetical protein
VDDELAGDPPRIERVALEQPLPAVGEGHVNPIGSARDGMTRGVRHPPP